MSKIMAVDDDLYILDLYKTILTEAGYEVGTAEDAMSAVTKFQEFKPDLLILDVAWFSINHEHSVIEANDLPMAF